MLKTRTHIMVPQHIVDAIDRLVGPRGRSRFFCEAAERELARRRLIAAAEKAAGAFADTDIPGWESPDRVSAWVRSVRDQDEDRLGRVAES